ncbi:MAG TPA: tryptophan synthase subunit alpha [Gemmatimonadaceae bacterium]|jgi:tryptophan synthase alpha chain|nr:tryptophan synthase subunit alpha [Gemmatimonadaceae bacterium]
MASGLATISSDRIARRFADLRAAGRCAFVPYVTAGHPDPARSVDLLQGLEAAGADLVEVGVPFSDPLADGAVIQASSQKALDHGVRLDQVLEIVSRASLSIPTVLFSYLNPLIKGGDDALVRASEAGVDGVLVTDLPLGADPEREAWFADSPLDFIRLVAPTTPQERIGQITRTGSGFVYLISRLGVTGERAELPPDLPATAARVRAATSLPLCIGFGISRPEQARAVSQIADGVVVGSAIVRAADESVEAALTLAAALRRGIDGD